MDDKQTRRSFLNGTIKCTIRLLILCNAKSVWSYRANEKLNIVCIVFGRQGLVNSKAVSNGTIVALCDLDKQRAVEAFKLFPSYPEFADFRKMFDKLPNSIGAVAIAASLKLGKHVQCQKPLVWSVHEVRVLHELSRKQEVVIQTGNQGTASSEFRKVVEFIRAEFLGEVWKVHAWLALTKLKTDQLKLHLCRQRFKARFRNWAIGVSTPQNIALMSLRMDLLQSQQRSLQIRRALTHVVNEPEVDKFCTESIVKVGHYERGQTSPLQMEKRRMIER